MGTCFALCEVTVGAQPSIMVSLLATRLFVCSQRAVGTLRDLQQKQATEQRAKGQGSGSGQARLPHATHNASDLQDLLSLGLLAIEVPFS